MLSKSSYIVRLDMLEIPYVDSIAPKGKALVRSDAACQDPTIFIREISPVCRQSQKPSPLGDRLASGEFAEGERSRSEAEAYGGRRSGRMRSSPFYFKY